MGLWHSTHESYDNSYFTHLWNRRLKYPKTFKLILSCIDKQPKLAQKLCSGDRSSSSRHRDNHLLKAKDRDRHHSRFAIVTATRQHPCATPGPLLPPKKIPFRNQYH